MSESKNLSQPPARVDPHPSSNRTVHDLQPVDGRPSARVPLLTNKQLLSMTSTTGEDSHDDDDSAEQKEHPPTISGKKDPSAGLSTAITTPGARRIRSPPMTTANYSTSSMDLGENRGEPNQSVDVALTTATVVDHDELEAHIRQQVISEAVMAEVIVVEKESVARPRDDGPGMSEEPEMGTRRFQRWKLGGRASIVAGVICILLLLVVAISVVLGTIMAKSNEATESAVGDPPIPDWWSERSPLVTEPNGPQHRAYRWMVNNGKGNPNGFGDNNTFWTMFALTTFYFATGGPTNWTFNDNWLDPEAKLCSWYPGDLCGYNSTMDGFEGFLNGNGNRNLQGGGGGNGNSGRPTPIVVKLNLSNNGLVGELPPELGMITTMKTLDLSNNTLYGTIPTVWDQWSNISEVRLEGNSFEGVVPTAVCEAFSPTEGYIFAMDCNSEKVSCPCCTICCSNGTSCQQEG